MSSKDLKDLLGAVADEGRDTVDLDEGHLVGKIRTRRRRQRVIVSAASVGTAAVIAAAAVAIVPNLRNQEPTVASGTGLSGTGIAGIGDRAVTCGAAVSGEPRPDAPIKLEAAGPVQPGTMPDYGTIDIQVTNTGSTAIDAITGNGAGITVVQNGVVVATPGGVRAKGYRVELQPGESKKYQATVSLRRCDAASTQTGQRLAAGSYQLYATKNFSPTDGGQIVEIQGGPWTVELK